MKSVLISIKPKWCELIASGKKTIEVRKTRPKIVTPFKVYIYCSEKDYDKIFCIDKFMHKVFLNGNAKQKVIGEFVCDEIFPIRVFENGSIQDYVCHGMERSCVPYNEIAGYIGYGCRGYGWHISDLVIYDNPRELSEFYTLKKCNSCKSGYESSACIYDEDCRVPSPITRPPMSWGYVESEGTE